jgi:hypothetical protein
MHQPDVSTPAQAAAVGIENMIRHNPVETGVFIAPDGRTLLKRKGYVDRVGFTRPELKRYSGATYTHNHPNGYGPSLEDVHLGAAYGIEEVRVVTSSFRHSVSKLDVRHIVPLLRTFPTAQASVHVAVRDDVLRGLVYQSDFGVEVLHRTWRLISSQLGFDYWRQQS